jgi:hypothetical protein
VLTVQRPRRHRKAVRPRRPSGTGRRVADRDDRGYAAMSSDDRLIWLSIALVAGVDGGVLAGLLTALAGGSKQSALTAGGVAALGTFGALLTVIRFLHDSDDK